MSLRITLYATLALLLCFGGQALVADLCGIVKCQQGQSCCGPKSNAPKCYWAHNESCCASTAAAPFPTSVAICAAGQACCGETSYAPQCHWPNETVCCASVDSLSTICSLGNTCCPTWGPPQMYSCCAKETSCCSNGGGVDEDGTCCANDTTCCLTDTGLSQCCTAKETCSKTGLGCINQTMSQL